MKKLLSFTIIFIALTSCSKSDNSAVVNSSDFHPPNWIQGTWGIMADATTSKNPMFKFTTNNLCQLSPSNSMCWKESIEQAPTIYAGSDVSTNSSYEANLIQSVGAVTLTLTFKKITATKIAWTYAGIDRELDKLD